LTNTEKEMKSNLWVLLALVLLFSMGHAQLIDSTLQYLAQDPPSDIPEKFAPNIISLENENEFGSVFSKDASEFFYAVDGNGRAEIRYTRLKNGSWSLPQTIISHKTYSHNDPFLSPDEKELYYISDRPLQGTGDKKDYDIWYSIREIDGWSEPINVGHPINTDKNEYYISFTSEGTLYYSSNHAAEENRDHDFDIYTAKKKEGVFQEPKRLDNAINSKRYEADVFVSPDESFLIFCAARKDGLGKGDLYISFKAADGSWTVDKNMGERINSENHELCPFVSADGKYFFFTSNQDIYWVDARIIDSYR